MELINGEADFKLPVSPAERCWESERDFPARNGSSYSGMSLLHGGFASYLCWSVKWTHNKIKQL